MHDLIWAMKKARKVPVRLTKGQREKLKKIIRSGREIAQVNTRARLLLLLDRQMRSEEICKALGIYDSRVRRVRKTFREQGFDAALYGQKRSGRPKEISIRERQEVIATACSSPPEGRERWTIRLLAERVGKRGIKVSREWIRETLLEDDLKPWREKNVVRSGGRRRVSSKNGGRTEDL